MTVFQNANDTVLNGTLEEIDEPILKHLQDVTIELPETNTGFKINFHFEPNEFFENTVLTKEYMLRNEYDKERDKNRITWVFYTFDYSCQSVT